MSLGRYPLQPEWWSRRYEYPWAIQYAKPNHVVADMGCGWMPRPFKERLAEVCKKVYAIDADARLLEQPNVRDNLIFVVRDFVNESLADLPRFDTIFCISVLEDLGVYLQDALMNFANLLKPGGQIVITFDVQLNESKPCPRYPGLLLTDMERAARAAGLMWSGSLDYSKEDCIKHVDFNLTVFHGVLKCRTK
jgi:2-polyprenyl-3-methyl-5-hydroxy-6-metoxy-1,4-benzoquinol methylase